MIVLLLHCFMVLQVLAIRPRVLQGCTTLNTNIYCYGGYTSALSGRFVNATSDIYTTNLAYAALYSPFPTLEWTLVNVSSTTNTSNLEPRAAMAITSLNETHYMTSGGESDGSTLDNSTIIFDSTTNTSSAVLPPPFSTYAGSLVATSSNTVWSYGGQLTNSSDPTPNSTLKLNLSTLPETWSTLAGSAFAPPSSRYGHAVVLKNTIIYYFGGFYASSLNSSGSQPVSLKTVNFYNTLSDQWGSIMTSGIVPSTRKYHTATLVDNSSVLIYGGARVDKPQSLPLLDYSYMFSLTKHIYHKIDLDSGVGIGAGPRSGHSALLYRKNILILFGYDSSGNLQNDAHVLDVSDPTDPVWGNSDMYVPGVFNSPDAENSAIKIIVGTVVGGVGLLLAIIAGAIYYLRKRRTQHPTGPYQQCLSSPQNQSTGLMPISTSLSNHGHNNSIDRSAFDMAIDNHEPPEYPSEPAPRYSLHAPPGTETPKPNLYTSR